MALTATVRAEISAALTSVLDQGTATAPLLAALTLSFTDGVGANQVNRVFADTRTLTASATENLDLAGVLTDAFGATITFARVKAVIIKAATTNTNNVVVGNHATAAFLGPFGAAAHTIAIPPGGVHLFARSDATGWVVTATTADMLMVTNSGGGTSVTYDIVILGGAT